VYNSGKHLRIEQWLSVCVVVDTMCDDRVTLVSRAEWRARPPRKTPVNISIPVNMTFIHHSDAPWRGTNLTECIKQVQSIQDFHMYFRGRRRPITVVGLVGNGLTVSAKRTSQFGQPKLATQPITYLLKHVHMDDYSRRFRRQFVAKNGDCRTKRRQSPFSVTVWTGLY